MVGQIICKSEAIFIFIREPKIGVKAFLFKIMSPKIPSGTEVRIAKIIESPSNMKLEFHTFWLQNSFEQYLKLHS